MFVLDTNTIIYYLDGDEKVSEFVESRIEDQELFILPTICVVEFLSYPKVSELDRDIFLSLTKRLQVLDLDYSNALIAADFRFKYRLKVVDSIIAAAAVSQTAILISRDQDFKKVKEIEVIDL